MKNPQTISRRERDLMDKFASLSSDKLESRLADRKGLTKLERHCIQKTLKGGTEIWTSPDRKVAVKRTAGGRMGNNRADFEVAQSVFKEAVVQECRTYDLAMDLAKWLAK